MIGTSAALAWSMASIVWGMTPSSAATTRMTMSVTCAPRARMAVKAAWPGRVDERDAVALPLDLVGADVLGDAAGLARHDVGRADAVEQQRLAVVDVAHDGDDRRPGSLVGLVLLVLVVEVAGQQLRLLLLAGVDQADVGADLGREELDHVVGQRLGRHDHLALQQQEAHDVAGAAVELGPEVACRRAALDDDLAVGHGCRRGLVRGELRRLELFEVAPAPAGPPLGRPPPGHAATPTRRRCARRCSATGAAAEAAATGGTTAVATTARTARPGGTTGTAGGPPTGARRVGAARARTTGGALGRRPPMPGGGGMGRPLGPSGGRDPGGGGTGLPEGLSGGRAGCAVRRRWRGRARRCRRRPVRRGPPGRLRRGAAAGGRGRGRPEEPGARRGAEAAGAGWSLRRRAAGRPGPAAAARRVRRRATAADQARASGPDGSAACRGVDAGRRAAAAPEPPPGGPGAPLDRSCSSRR